MKGIQAAAVILLLTACAGESPDQHDAGATPATPVDNETAPTAGLDRAEAAISDFGTRLRSALQVRLRAHGPLDAVDFCYSEAPAIAAAVMAEHGVRMGRTSSRVRNPTNTPNDWQAKVLSGFAANADAGQLPEAQRAVLVDDLPDGVALRLMKGIRVEAPCLLCHGGPPDPVLAQALAQRYPNDTAIGYAEGELRGAFWVEVASDTE